MTFEGCTTADTRSLCGSIPAGSGSFTAQIFDNPTSFLGDAGAKGGPLTLAQQVASFFIGINDLTGAAFTPVVFNLFYGWASPGVPIKHHWRWRVERRAQPTEHRRVLRDLPRHAECRQPFGQGATEHRHRQCRGESSAGFAYFRVAGIYGLVRGRPPLAGQVFEVTDLGRATITGQCADLGKLQGPILRGLAARAPYFHNGSAATLLDVVNFYDQRFSIGFTDQQKSDLVAFLNAF